MTRPLKVLDRVILVLVTATLVVSCVGGGGQDSKKELNASSSNEAADSRGRRDSEVSGDFRSVTYSLSNNPLNGKTVPRKKAQDIADRLEGVLKKPDIRDRAELMALMSARRFAGASMQDVVSVAAKLIAVEVKKDIKNELPDVAKLELVLAAIKNRKFAFAEHFILDLKDTENKAIKAAAFTAEGMIALLDDRLPEAVSAWEQALKIDPNYEPALLNVGFTALKYGDFETGRKRLTPLGRDYIAATALITGDRLTGNAVRADDSCQELLTKHGDYKPLVYNCALNQAEGVGNAEQAEKLFKDMRKIKTPGGDYDEKAERILMRIEDERSARKEKSELEKRKAAGDAAPPDGKAIQPPSE